MSLLIDLSSNNGSVNFPALQKYGVTDVILRATLGCTEKDSTLITNAMSANKAGIEVSYYHVAYPGTKFTGAIKTNAVKQANNFLATIVELPKPKWVVVDLEIQITIENFEFEAWLHTFLDTVEDALLTIPIIYTYKSYLDNHLSKDHKFGTYPLWIANYSVTKNPPLPQGWDKYFLFQYTDKGIVPGIRGNVDISKLQ